MKSRLLLYTTALSITLVRAQVNITYPSNTPAAAFYVQDNFFGISFEMQVINTLIGNDPTSIPTPIEEYLKSIRSRMSNPLRLRVGGNSMDNSYYIPSQTTMFSGTIDNVNYSPMNYGPLLLNTVAALADAISGATINLGLGLIHIPNSAATVALALNATSILGNRLDSFLLGNEPDLYELSAFRPAPNYTVQNYIDDYANILGQMHSNGPLVNARMAGPTICCFWDLNTLLTNGYLGAFKGFLKYITLQHYPQSNCPSTHPSFGLEYYLNHANVVGLATWNLPGVITAQQAGLNVSMTEFNTASCGGIPGISNTFGAALWTIDYALQLASIGYNSAYIHTREAGVTYNLFDPPAPNLNQSMPGWTTGAPYHALLVVAEALHSSSSNAMAVVDCTVVGPLAATNALAAYAVYPSPTASTARQAPSRLVLINYNATGSVTFQFNVNTTGIDPTSGSQPNIGSATVKYLIGESVGANLDISWAGEVVSGGGDMVGEYLTTSVDGCGSSVGCGFNVPGPGVALVFFDAQAASASSNSNSNSSSQSGTNLASSAGPTETVDPGFVFPSKANIRSTVDIGNVALAILLIAFVL